MKVEEEVQEGSAEEEVGWGDGPWMYEVGTVWAAMWGLVGLLRGALLSNLQDEDGWFLMQEPKGGRLGGCSGFG